MGLEFLKTYLKLADHTAVFELVNQFLADRKEHIASVFCFDFHLNII